MASNYVHPCSFYPHTRVKNIGQTCLHRRLLKKGSKHNEKTGHQGGRVSRSLNVWGVAPLEAPNNRSKRRVRKRERPYLAYRLRCRPVYPGSGHHRLPKTLHTSLVSSRDGGGAPKNTAGKPGLPRDCRVQIVGPNQRQSNKVTRELDRSKPCKQESRAASTAARDSEQASGSFDLRRCFVKSYLYS